MRPEFEAALKNVQTAAAAKPEETASLLLWMQRNDRAADALVWAAELPAQTKAVPVVSAALGFCGVAVQDWPGLEKLVVKADWGALDFLRRALLARVFKERGNADLARTTWRDAVTTAARQTDGLLRLLRVAESWQWGEEARDIYWALADDPVTRQSALQQLYRDYSSAGDTAGLNRVVARLSELDPGSDILKNNRLIYSLLSGDRSAANLALARALYLKEPTNAAFTSTYAFALYVSGRTGEAVATMNTLRNDQLEEPANAAYYGVFLVANGAPADARKYLDLARQAKLLPEERQLVEKARAAIPEE